MGSAAGAPLLHLLSVSMAVILEGAGQIANDGKKSVPAQVRARSLREPHCIFKGAEVKNFLFRMLRLYPALVKIRFNQECSVCLSTTSYVFFYTVKGFFLVLETLASF